MISNQVAFSQVVVSSNVGLNVLRIRLGFKCSFSLYFLVFILTIWSNCFMLSILDIGLEKILEKN